MSMYPLILICDDDPVVHESLGLYLTSEGYEHQSAYDGQQALEMFENQHPDLIVLDLMMPKMSGTDVCRTIRQKSSVPIIMLTAKGEEIDRILGLELGADDYIVKPFSPREVLARIKAVLRRFSEKTEEEDSSILTSNVGQVFSREQILSRVWGYDYFGDTRTVDAHIKRIRQKLPQENVPWALKTVYGVGYRFEVNA